MNILGFEFNTNKRKNANPNKQPDIPETTSFIPKPDEDGGVNVPYGGTQSFVYDLGVGGLTDETKLIERYRDLSMQPEVEIAIDDIVNQAIILDDKTKPPVSINLDNLELDEGFKEILISSFEKIVKLLRFNVKGYEIFRQWYIDGRLAYHIIPNPYNPSLGISELRQIDVLKLRKYREIGDMQDQEGHIIKDVINQYYLYNENGFSPSNNNTKLDNFTQMNNPTSQQAIKIASDAILFATSGLKDDSTGMILSYLNAAIRPMNMLRNMEDASIIYTLSRAPQRRVFQPDITTVPSKQVPSFIHKMMSDHRNQIRYNQTTGEIRDDRRWLTLLDDYWFPKKNGMGTSVDILQGDKSLLDPDFLNTFETKLTQALRVPSSRRSPDATFMFGQGAEISRDELKFMKFVNRLRMQFSQIFLKALKTELMLTQVIDENEWNEIEPFIMFDFTEDSYFQEMKDQEVYRQRAATANSLMPFIGFYLSPQWLLKNVFGLNEQEIMQMQQENKAMPLPNPEE